MFNRTRQAGISLIELIMFIVVVSVGIVGILQVMNQTARHSADPQLRKQALAIAEALMEEVQLARFTYCDPEDSNAETATGTVDCTTTAEQLGPEPDNVRPFDNVNDYVTAWGAAEPAFGNPLTDVAGSDISVGGAYAATLTITPQALNGIQPVINGTSTDTVNALRIAVTVTYGGEQITLEGYRTRYAPRSVP